MPAPSTPPGDLLQLLPEAVVQTDALWVITYLNPAWHKLTGHSLDGTLGRSLLDFVHPDDTGTLRSGMPVFRLRLANSDYRWMRLQLQPQHDAANRVISRQGVLIEITEITEQVLMEVRQRFLRLLETIDGVVWEAELGVGNTFLSPQVERLFGYTVEEWRADPGFWRQHVHPDDLPEALAIDDAAYNATHSYAYEMSYRLIAKSGKVVWVRDLCRVVVDQGRPNRMIGLMIDVTQQKNTELELVGNGVRSLTSRRRQHLAHRLWRRHGNLEQRLGRAAGLAPALLPVLQRTNRHAKHRGEISLRQSEFESCFGGLRDLDVEYAAGTPSLDIAYGLQQFFAKVALAVTLGQLGLCHFRHERTPLSEP